MKYPFFVLVLANLVFFLWESGFRPADDGPRELPLPQATERIELMSERPAVPVPARAESPVAAPVSQESATADAGTESPPVEEASQEAPVAEPSPPPPEQEAAGEAASKAAAAEAEARKCFRIGPYAARAQAQEALELVKTHVDKAELVILSTGVPDGWWVLFPKASNLEAARANRRMLLEKGVQDLWLFDKGELAGAISLGLYSIHDGAIRAQADFMKKNLVTEVVPRLVSSHSEWVRIPWPGTQMELEEVVHLLNSEGTETKLPAPVPCE